MEGKETSGTTAIVTLEGTEAGALFAALPFDVDLPESPIGLDDQLPEVQPQRDAQGLYLAHLPFAGGPPPDHAPALGLSPDPDHLLRGVQIVLETPHLAMADVDLVPLLTAEVVETLDHSHLHHLERTLVLRRDQARRLVETLVCPLRARARFRGRLDLGHIRHPRAVDCLPRAAMHHQVDDAVAVHLVVAVEVLLGDAARTQLALVVETTPKDRDQGLQLEARCQSQVTDGASLRPAQTFHVLVLLSMCLASPFFPCSCPFG